MIKGNRVNQLKSLEENKIKNGDIIILSQNNIQNLFIFNIIK